MSLMSWQLPHAPLFGRVLLAQALGVLTAVAAASIVGLVVPTTQAYAWKAGLACVAIGVVAVGYVRENHPFDAFGAANHVTTFRAVLVALVAALIGEARTDAIAWTAAAIRSRRDGAGRRGRLAGQAIVDGEPLRRTVRHGGGCAADHGARSYRVAPRQGWRMDRARRRHALPLRRSGTSVALAGSAPAAKHPAPGHLRRADRRARCCRVAFCPGSPQHDRRGRYLASLLWSFAVDVIWLRRHGA